MFTDKQKLNVLIDALTGWAGYSYNDLDDETFLKVVKKAKQQREQLEQIKEIAYKALEPICYKSYCESCLCYDYNGEKLSDVLNRYFTRDGEFNDENGEFEEDLKALIESERGACNRALPVAQQIIKLLEDGCFEHEELVGRTVMPTVEKLVDGTSVQDITIDTVRAYLKEHNQNLPLSAIENIVKLTNICLQERNKTC